QTVLVHCREEELGDMVRRPRRRNERREDFSRTGIIAPQKRVDAVGRRLRLRRRRNDQRGASERDETPDHCGTTAGITALRTGAVSTAHSTSPFSAHRTCATRSTSSAAA